MKRILLFFFVLFLFIQAYTQSNKNWITDLDILKTELLQKEYLFSKFSKTKFKKEVHNLKNLSPISKEEEFWIINHLLSKFNNPNITLQNIEFKRFPFEIKQFEGIYYITSISSELSNYLGYKLQKINGFPLSNILKKAQNNSLNIKPFLEYYKFSKTDTLHLELLSDNEKHIEINFLFDKFYDLEEMTKITPKKIPFYLEKQDRWFWQYGINFGQQVYFKYNIGLSKEFIEKHHDNLQVSYFKLAKNYNLPLQSIYDAPTFDDFTTKLFCKFKKRRYKKLFIDFRNNKTGNVLVLDNFIQKLKKIKRINKRNRLYIFVDKSISTSAMEMVLAFKNETKALIVGEEVTKTACSTDKIKSFLLDNNNFKIYYPTQYFKQITIEPDVKVITTFDNYINGVDPILQKALNL